MVRLLSLCAVPPATGDTLAYRNRKARFEKRNKKIMEMSPDKQAQFKHIIDSRGGQRYIP